MKSAINESKTKVIQKKIVDSKGDQKQLSKIVETLLGRTKEIVLPEYQDPASLASRFNMFFIGKLDKIRLEFPYHLILSSQWPQSYQLVQLYLINLLWFQKRS